MSGADPGVALLRVRTTPRPSACRLLIATLVAAGLAENAAVLTGRHDLDAAIRLARIGAVLSAPLQRLRECMWQQTGAAPSAEVLGCPALGLSGRATGIGGARLVRCRCVSHESTFPVRSSTKSCTH